VSGSYAGEAAFIGMEVEVTVRAEARA